MDANVIRVGPTRLDQFGILISSICLVHCLALPILIALLPAWEPLLPPDSLVHPLLIGLALPITGLALARGYRAHRDGRAAAYGIVGLSLIAVAAFLATAPLTVIGLTIGGGLLVAAAHVTNWRAHGPLCVDDHHGQGAQPAR